MFWIGLNRNSFRDALSAEIEAGLVSESRHPELPLSLFCYTARCQYERAWTERTKVCRGIIFDDERCVAKPFDKFLNDGEHAEGEIPWHLPCVVSEKLDGSMITAFHYAGEWRCATKGSFVSQQAKWAQAIADEEGTLDKLPERATFIFELIHPENRIVCNYGDCRRLVCLTAFLTEIGQEVDAQSLRLWGVPHIVDQMPWTGATADQVRAIIRDEDEGYVVRFENGFRCKIKGERYLYLHRLLSSLTPRRIFDELVANGSLDKVGIPEEHLPFAEKIADGFLDEFRRIESQAKAGYECVKDHPSRRDQAMALADFPFPNARPVVFVMLDGKDPTLTIWKAVKRSLKNADVPLIGAEA